MKLTIIKFLILASAVSTLNLLSLDEIIYPDENTVTDSLSIEEIHSLTVDQLKDSLDIIIDARNRKTDPIVNENLIYSENFHLNALNDPVLYFKLGKFNLRSYQTKNYSIYQNLNPHFICSKNVNQLSFDSEYYILKPSLTFADLALGDNNMNHGFVSFNKGALFNLENVNLSFSYLGQEGTWIGIPETGYSFKSQIFYKSEKSLIDIQLVSFDQNISTRKLSTNTDNTDSITNEIFLSPSIMWYNPILNLGYRFEEWEVQSEERRENQLIANKNFALAGSESDITIEYFNSNQKENENNFSLSGSSEYLKNNFFLMGQGYFEEKINHFSFQTEYLYHGLIGPQVNYSAQKDTINYSQTEFGLIFKHQLGKLDIKYIIPDSSYVDYYLESKLKLNLSLDKLDFTFFHWNRYYPNWENNLIFNNSPIPEIQMKNGFELKYNLKYGNHVRLGISHIYHSNLEHLDGSQVLQYTSSIADLYLAVGITSRFEIQADVRNLTNSEYLFEDQDIMISGTHFNVRVKWIFLN